jgi:uncharacterized protein YkwD
MQFKTLILLFFLSFIGCKKQPYDSIYHNTKDSKSVQMLLHLHNEQREKKGLSDFVLDPYLCQYAQKHAEWMADKNILKHSNINNLMDRYYTAGENIAWNQKTEVEVLDSWMHSSGHRANIMNRNFTKIGFGIAPTKKGELYWCTCFAGKN